MHTGDIRAVTEPSRGETYYARLAPLERPRGGISSDMKAVVFEREDGAWAGSAPVYGNARLWTLSDEDMQRLARRALGGL